MTLWVVRAGRQGEQEQGALEHSVVIIGWDLPDLSSISDMEELRNVYMENHPTHQSEALKQFESWFERIGVH